MKIATLLFTYNRSYHTEQVITALQRNTILPQKLFVFQDGLKQDSDDSEWNKVNKLIHDINWCEKEIIVSEFNKGLAVSIVSGIDYAFREYDAVIVLEDDCVPAANFVSFMYQCFEKYQDNKSVYSVSGYSWPIDLQKDNYDVYGNGRLSSWGWGIWKDRWTKYSQDYEVIKRIQTDKAKSINLALWGRDLENMLLSRQKGMNDSWAVFWALKIIEMGGICIAPYKSLIRNIGMDGSGTNCKVTYKFDVELNENLDAVFQLPEKIEIKNTTKYAFADLYGSYTACEYEKAGGKTSVIVCGAGNCFFRYEKVICEEYNIMAFIDCNKYGWFAGRKVIGYQDVNRSIYAGAKILIMIHDYKECLRVKDLLIDIGKAAEDRIIICKDYYG